ncbi:hypothetical protein A2U01_0056760 [Trifolium medium]|uniref:Uncharacterized protein n=1 Tax=Trifolium medium TaxID=97028 RepID=A0A392RH11_9FABA|nr:hypothetical protein [Trifolium medium]
MTLGRNSAAGASSNDSEFVGPHRSKPDVASSSGSNSELVAVLRESDATSLLFYIVAFAGVQR